MLTDIIKQYLESHKRLVVPQLGTFIVKEPGRSVVFSELLKRDDGVLRQLLGDAGLGELEAAGEIDRFVFEVRHAVQHGREHALPGFGVMKPGPNETICFVFATAAPSSDAAPARTAGPSAAEQGPAARQAGQPAVENGPSEDRQADPSEASASGAGQAPPEAGGAKAGRPALQPEKVAEAVRSAFAEPHVSPSVKMNPDPSVRGLRYGRPPKSTDAYRYVDRAPRRRADRFIWIALIAAAIAVAAIAFGYWRDVQQREAEEQYLELPAEVPQGASAAEPAQRE